MKRVLSLFLALVMLVTMVPVPAKASQTDPGVDANDMTVEGTDSFGALLSEELNGESVIEDTYIDGYAITGLTFSGNTAAVTYGAIGPARLVVSIYTEDGLTMLSTANTNVAEGEGEVTLVMPGEMPEYFYAAAFLLNGDDLTPLCDSYDTPMYTREMQELLDSTVNDYDADLVMNLDDREDTNFLVFEEDTVRAESSSAVNTVISADDEKLLYVIGNADETVKNLQKGDIFSCSYGNNNLLIVKVDTLSVDGTTVTIKGADMEMEEVFSHVKIEYEGGGADVEVDESGCYEGIEYLGKSDGGSGYAARRSTYADGGLEDKTELTFLLDEVKIGEASMKGTLKITPTAKFEYYATSDRKYVDLGISLKVSLSVNFKGKVPLKEVPLGPWGISPVPGVYIGFEPAFVVEFEASLSFGVTFFTETGITYEMGKAPKRHSVKPTVDIDIQVEGKLFVGIDLDPTVEVVGGKVIDLTLEMGIGFELSGKMGGTLFDGIQIAGERNQEEKIHTCEKCLGVEVAFKVEISFKIEFLKLKALTKEFKLTALKINLGSFYWSFTHDEFGWGGCPRLSYRVVIQVKDADGNPVEGIAVYNDKGQEQGKTDEKGQVIVYRKEGSYVFSATVNDVELQKTKIVKRAGRVLLKEGADSEISSIFGDLEEEELEDYGPIIADGDCGEFVSWTLYSNGTLIIEGSGAITVPTPASRYFEEYQGKIETVIIREGVTSIPEYLFSGYTGISTLMIADTVKEWGQNCFASCTGLRYLSVPVDYPIFNTYGIFDHCTNVEYVRYTAGRTGKMNDRNGSYGSKPYLYTFEYHSKDKIKTVEFAEGVTSIADSVFSGATALTTVQFPDTLKIIGLGSFSGCFGLTKIDLPYGMENLGMAAFSGCTGLTEVEIPETIVYIFESAFGGCTGLTHVEIPEGVTTLYGGFENCTGLKSVELPDSLVDLRGAFSGCTALESIDLPDSVEYLIETFEGCTGLKEIKLPNGLKEIGSWAFSGCTALTEVTIPDTVTEIGYEVFADCTGLKKVHIPEGVTVIDSGAFMNCTALEKIDIPGTVTTIGEGAFRGCTGLKEVHIPISVTKINKSAFEGCTGLIEVEIPEFVTTLGERAFAECTGLTRATIPDNIGKWEKYVFEGCTNLKFVSLPIDYAFYEKKSSSRYTYYEMFKGCTNLEHIRYTPGKTGVMVDRAGWLYSGYAYQFSLEYARRDTLKTIELMPGVRQLSEQAFVGVTANVYYDDESGIWTEDKRTGYGGTLTWLPLSELEAAAVMEEIPEETTEPVEEIAETQPEETIPAATGTSSSASQPSGSPEELYSIFGGDYGSEETETQTLTVASFSGLVAGEKYVLLVVRNLKAADMLDGSNLIYIAQDAAKADGTLTFRYAKREDVKQSYVMVVGPSGKDLKDAVITFPEMKADGDVHLVNPTVTYDGKVLTEGKDYNILGAGSYVKPGQYLCYIQGIHDYSGLVTCAYTVVGGMPGDVDLNGNVDVDDVLALLWYVLFPDDYPIDAEADFDHNGSTDVDDVLTLLWYVLFPDDYPL